MWCEYDDDDSGHDSGGDSRDEGRRAVSTSGSANKHSHHRHRHPHRLLRVSVQTLDGRVCDDEDEDSETDDGESETDGEVETDGDDEGDVRAPGRSLRWGRRGRSKDQPRSSSGASRASGERAGRAGDRGGRRASGARTNKKKKEEEFDEVDCQRKEELASVLRRLRVAIRRMDGVLTEEKVWCGPPGRTLIMGCVRFRPI